MVGGGSSQGELPTPSSARWRCHPWGMGCLNALQLRFAPKNPRIGDLPGSGVTCQGLEGPCSTTAVLMVGSTAMVRRRRGSVGSGMRAAGRRFARMAQPSCRQQPCGELHKLPIWQRSPSGEGHHGPMPAAIPVLLCRPGVLPQPSCLGGVCGGPSAGQQEGQGYGTPISCPPGGH